LADLSIQLSHRSSIRCAHDLCWKFLLVSRNFRCNRRNMIGFVWILLFVRKISLDCQLPFYSAGITEFHLTSGNNEFLILTLDFDKFWLFASFTLLLFWRPCLICRFHSCVMIPSKLIPSKIAITTIIRKSLKTILRVLISSLANQIRSWHSNPRPIRKASSKNNHLVTSNFHPNYFLCLFKTAIKNYNRTWTLINLNTENLLKIYKKIAIIFNA
jgi:hypothetical protein